MLATSDIGLSVKVLLIIVLVSLVDDRVGRSRFQLKVHYAIFIYIIVLEASVIESYFRFFRYVTVLVDLVTFYKGARFYDDDVLDYIAISFSFSILYIVVYILTQTLL